MHVWMVGTREGALDGHVTTTVRAVARADGTIRANGVDFAYLEAGPPDGPLALCLHGFPDAAPSWRHLLPALAGAGFHAVAPWMRGYAPTSIPDDNRYQTGALAADAVALHEALGGDERAVLVGHDWGAAAVYGAASHAPERWRRVVAMAVPPAGAVGASFLTSYDQQKRSWYMFFFQTALADMAVPFDDLAFIDRLWEDWSPGYDAGEELNNVKDALRDPANLTAALGYYRALFDPSRQAPELAAEQSATGMVPPQPLLYLHGRNDGCIGAEVAEAGAALLPAGSSAEILDGVGHFLHLERPDEVNRRIVEFLTA